MYFLSCEVKKTVIIIIKAGANFTTAFPVNFSLVICWPMHKVLACIAIKGPFLSHDRVFYTLLTFSKQTRFLSSLIEILPQELYGKRCVSVMVNTVLLYYMKFSQHQ